MYNGTSPSKKVDAERAQLSLSDKLALERTKLASRRTLLAYFRTALAFLVSGGGMSELLDGHAYQVLSTIMLAAVPIFILLGICRFVYTEWKWHSVWGPH